MSVRLVAASVLAVCMLAASASAHAQDASAWGNDAAVTSDGDLAAASTVGREGACQPDPAPPGHDVRVETILTPPQPVVGDRILVTYRVHYRNGDAVQFDPDPVAFSHPDQEVEYARQQPDRDRRQHAGGNGHVYAEVQVAIQAFKTGEVEIAPQLARLTAAGDVTRVCTPAVHFRVHDPFGNEARPTPRDVTPPESVSEDALWWRWIALGIDALFLVVLTTLIVSEYLRRRPRPVVPPAPPRPAWIVAIEALDAIAHGDLLARGATKDYYDAISDVVRRYVGASRGFDALEMTTDEVLRRVRKTPLPGVTPVEVEHLLRECDLVKFARYVPSHEESEKILSQGYSIVRQSSPAPPTTRPEGVKA